MRVKQLIEKLEKLDQDSVVCVDSELELSHPLAIKDVEDSKISTNMVCINF